MRNVGIYTLTGGTFIVGLAELIIIGILDLIARDIGVSISKAGQVVAAYSIVFACAPPLILLLARRIERKAIALGAMALLIAGCVGAALSTSFLQLMISRIVLAAGSGVFVAVALGIAARLVAPEARGGALSLILMGFGSALVFGVPLGVLLGASYGWRVIFWIIAVLGVVTAVAVRRIIPTIVPPRQEPLIEQLRPALRPATIAALMITLFWMTGYAAIFTYVSPALRAWFDLSVVEISMVLLLFGVACLVGSRIGGVLADRWGARAVVLTSLPAHAFTVLLVPLIAPSVWVAVLFVVAWGLTSWATTPAQQSHLVTLAPRASEFVLSLNNSVLHIGIALGAGAGGFYAETAPNVLGLVTAASLCAALAAAVLSFRTSNRPMRQEA